MRIAKQPKRIFKTCGVFDPEKYAGITNEIAATSAYQGSRNGAIPKTAMRTSE
jgi:hypothetical protein